MVTWSWIRYDDPWRDDRGLGAYYQSQPKDPHYGQQAIHGMQVFDTAAEARASLQTNLEGGVGSDPKFTCARLLREQGRDGELMMWFMVSTTGWIVFRVPDGQAPLDAAVATIKRWKPTAHAAYFDWLNNLGADAYDPAIYQDRFGATWRITPGIWFPDVPGGSGGGGGSGCLITAAMLPAFVVLATILAQLWT